jgi:hypothetical protein
LACMGAWLFGGNSCLRAWLVLVQQLGFWHACSMSLARSLDFIRRVLTSYRRAWSVVLVTLPG